MSGHQLTFSLGVLDFTYLHCVLPCEHERDQLSTLAIATMAGRLVIGATIQSKINPRVGCTVRTTVHRSRVGRRHGCDLDGERITAGGIIASADVHNHGLHKRKF